MSRLSHDHKEQAIAGMRLLGTKKAGALAADIPIEKLNAEIKKSAVFKKRVSEALSIGKSNLGDNALEIISTYALNPPPKTDRNQLTAAIALANAFIPGFRGATTVQGKIDHDVRVITAVPRPNYQITVEPEKKLLDNPSKSVLKSKKKVKIVDQEGNYIGTKVETVEDVIEGEIVNERD